MNFLFATTLEGVLLYCLGGLFVVSMVACYQRSPRAGDIMGIVTMLFMLALASVGATHAGVFN